MRRHSLRVLALVAVLALPAGVAAQAPPSAPGPTATTGVEALAAPLFLELAAMKGMGNPGAPPPLVGRSREETRRFVEQELDRRYSAPRIEAERKGMVAWGMVPPDYDLRRLFLDLMEEQIAAYYDPRARVMALATWLPPELQQTAMLHEMVHALQDREVPIEVFLDPTPGAGDQLLARQALLEGEAVALSLDLMLRTQGLDFASLPDLGSVRALIAAATVGPAINAAPKFIRDLLLFPYVEGLNFAHQFRRRQPWSAVGALYRDPPRSTTQILHPEKRLDRREDPVAVALPDLGADLATASVAAEDDLGEFALGAVLGLHLGEEGGRRAALGWRGDRYRVWEPEPGRFALAYVLVLETEARAREAARALAGSVEKRHAPLAGKGAAAGPLTTWSDGGRAWAVEQRGAEVVLIEGVPAASAQRIRDALWASRPAPAPR